MRLPAWVGFLLLALCGAGIGLGAAAIERGGASRPYEAQAVASVVILALLTPLHARVVLGPFGRRG